MNEKNSRDTYQDQQEKLINVESHKWIKLNKQILNKTYKVLISIAAPVLIITNIMNLNIQSKQLEELNRIGFKVYLIEEMFSKYTPHTTLANIIDKLFDMRQALNTINNNVEDISDSQKSPEYRLKKALESRRKHEEIFQNTEKNEAGKRIKELRKRAIKMGTIPKDNGN